MSFFLILIYLIFISWYRVYKRKEVLLTILLIELIITIVYGCALGLILYEKYSSIGLFSTKRKIG